MKIADIYPLYLSGLESLIQVQMTSVKENICLVHHSQGGEDCNADWTLTHCGQQQEHQK